MANFHHQKPYGDGDEVTVVNYGTNVGAKFTTTYFRHYVTVTAGYAGFAATLNLLRRRWCDRWWLQCLHTHAQASLLLSILVTPFASRVFGFLLLLPQGP